MQGTKKKSPKQAAPGIDALAPRRRLLMTGVRKGGDPDYHFHIFGDPASQFPPLVLKMTLQELQQWLHRAPAPTAGFSDGGPKLRPVG